MGHDRPSRRGVTHLDGERAPTSDGARMSGELAEYADRLLLSTGLHADDALLIARGELEPEPHLLELARALRAGWQAGEDQP